MGRDQTQTQIDQEHIVSLNESLVYRVLQEVIKCGVTEFCICSGSRNQPLFAALQKEDRLKKYYWFEERSAAFFALGRSIATEKPVAVVTTSGTAAGELLPAAMEAHYSGVPLLLITADRPRNFRGTGAPQSGEQVGLFGVYAHYELDIALEEPCDLSHWDQKGAAHLNVCLDEPFNQKEMEFPSWDFSTRIKNERVCENLDKEYAHLDHFLEQSSYPLIVVSTLKKEYREAVVRFLLKVKLPIILEGVSGLREDPRLQKLRICKTEKIWDHAGHAGYPIDGILRIGGVPTLRLWRDLEDKPDIRVCSIHHLPFSGLSERGIICVDLNHFFDGYQVPKEFSTNTSAAWLEADRAFRIKILRLFEEEPSAEQSMVHHLSHMMPEGSGVFLGNSLPIREWDYGAVDDDKKFSISASRGLSGIDGQISTFLGQCDPNKENWALLGDLTTLYDLSGPWMMSEMPDCKINLVVINNSGGKIFARMYPGLKELTNPHQLSFAPFASLWNIHYELWTSVPTNYTRKSQHQVIELKPDWEATQRFWKKSTT